MKTHKVKRTVFIFFLISQVLSAEIRVWTESKTGRTLTAELISKSKDGQSVNLKTQRGKMITLKKDRLSKRDQSYIDAQKTTLEKQSAGPLKMRARTIATSTKRSRWNYVWGNVDELGAIIVENSGKRKVSRRVVGVDLTSPIGSSGGDYVVEMYWFGFPFDNKNKRYICSAVIKTVSVPAGGKTSIAIASDYDYIDNSLTLTKSDPYYREWTELYVHEWSGYTYAGWVVRVSDGKGKVIVEQGAQPSFIRHIQSVPLPRK